MAATDPIQVRNNVAERRFEVEIDGRLAMLQYQQRESRIVLIHTEVPPELEGHGIAGQLAKTALDHARANNLAVVPLCPYVASYIKRHPEYQDLVEQEP